MTSCPASWSALTDSGYLSTQSPTTKKVVFTLYFARMSMRCWVSSFPHGDAKVRQFTENCRTSLLYFYDSINASYLQQNLVQKSKSFLVDDDGHRRCGTSSFRCLFCNFSRETRIGAKEKYSGNQERPELKNSREFRKEAKAILVGKTEMKNENFTREKRNRRKRAKCKTG